MRPISTLTTTSSHASTDLRRADVDIVPTAVVMQRARALEAKHTPGLFVPGQKPKAEQIAAIKIDIPQTVPKQRVLVVSDAVPGKMVNGVARTVETTLPIYEKLGCEAHLLTPYDLDQFHRIPIPASLARVNGVQWPINARGQIENFFKKHGGFDHVIVMTEAGMGRAVADYCKSENIPYVSAFCTQFDEYVGKLLWKPIARIVKPIATRLLVNWHAKANMTLVAAPVAVEMVQRGADPNKIVLWTRGVDREQFNPGKAALWERAGEKKEGPLGIFVSRVQNDKQIEVGLRQLVGKWPGKLVVVGEGPDKARLQKEFPSVEFIGERKGDKLAAWYANADVMFLASQLETFGLVQVEAMACGTPVAALPSAATDFVIGDSRAGTVSEDLLTAGLALANEKLANKDAVVEACVERASIFTWQKVCEIALFASMTGKERAARELTA